MLQVAVPGYPPLAVYRVNEAEFYCTDDTCTHGAASLADEGILEGYIVECSWHEGKFDVRTGQPCALPCTVPLKTYPVIVEGDEVVLRAD